MHLLHMVFAAYICLSTIIMLNMLIAMMNSTYSLVSSGHEPTWRIESLRTALWFERKMPLIKRSMFLRFKMYRRVVDDRPRWYIAYIPEQVGLTAPYRDCSPAKTPSLGTKHLQDKVPFPVAGFCIFTRNSKPNQCISVTGLLDSAVM